MTTSGEPPAMWRSGDSPWLEPSPFDVEDRVDWNEPEPDATGDTDAEQGSEAEVPRSHGSRARRLAELRERNEYLVLTDAELDEMAELSIPPWALDVRTFAEELSEPYEGERHRVKGLMLCGGNSLIYGLYKSGKTTLGINLLRSLVDEDPFLGEYAIEPPEGRVAYLNYELTKGQFRQWCVKQGIRNPDRFVRLDLRGKGAYLTDDDIAAWMVAVLRKQDVKVLIVDNLLASLEPGEDPNKHAVASRYTRRIDDLKDDAGVEDCVLLAHTGHPSRFSRGGIPLNSHAAHSSHFMGWPDDFVGWLTDSSGRRFLAPQDGRVSTAEDPIPVTFDPETRRMELDRKSSVRTPRARSGGRPRRSTEQVTKDVRKLLKVAARRGDGWTSKNAIETGVTGSRDVIRQALDGLVRDGSVEVKDGDRGSILHRWID